jgi:DNA-binding transcriptional ArsR family regulator
MEAQKVLFLAANPIGTTPLQLDEEIRTITQKIRASEFRDTLNLYSVWAVHPDDLLQYLNEHKPRIVHFSGHGSNSGEIVLVDDNGDPKSISIEAIRALFTTLKDNIRLVVLNACYSKIQAQVIREVIDCIIGMNTAIGDKAAIVFAASLYRAIGFGRSLKEAFDQGITALLLEGITEENTPELLVKDGVDPAQIFLITNHDSTTLSTVSEPFDSLLQKIAALSNTQKRLLLEIARLGSIYAGELASKLSLSRRETVYSVEALKTQGLVEIDNLTDYRYRLSRDVINVVEKSKNPSVFWTQVEQSISSP